MGIEHWQAENGFQWDHIFLDPEGVAWLEAQPLDAIVRAALVADDTRPRASEYEHGAVVVLRGVNLMDGGAGEDMISVRLWVSKGHVISVWRRPLRAMNTLRDAAEAGTGPVSAGALVSQLAFRLTETANPLITALGEQVDALEDAQLGANSSAEPAGLTDLRRVIIILRRYFAPQVTAFKALAGSAQDWIEQSDRRRLVEAADRMARLTEELDALGQRSQVIQDHEAALRADRMNQRMFVMSIAAALFLPLGFLTGLLGVNVGGMPGVDSPWAFWIFCAALCVVALGQWWLFRKMGIVGRED